MAASRTKVKAETEAAPLRATKKPPVKLPKSLGACADLYADLREKRLLEAKEVTKIEEQEKFVKNHLTEVLCKGDDRGAVGQHHRVQVEVENVAQVEDWDAFYAHIKKTGDFGLLNRALNAAAIKERWDDNKVVPGVKAVPVVKLRLHKL